MNDEVKPPVDDSDIYEGASIEIGEDGLEYFELPIKHGRKTRTFTVKESGYSQLQAIKAKLNKQDDAQKEQALGNFGGWLIGLSCVENGEKVDPSVLPARIGTQLEKAAMFINGIGDEAEKRAKNAHSA